MRQKLTGKNEGLEMRDLDYVLNTVTLISNYMFPLIVTGVERAQVHR